MSINGTVLIVESFPEVLRELKEMLEGLGLTTLLATSAQQGLEFALSQTPDAVIVNLHLPGTDGLALARSLRTEPATAATPIIFLAANAGRQDRVACLAVGHSDVVATPMISEEVIARLRTHLALVHTRRELTAINRRLSVQVAGETALRRRAESEATTQRERLTQILASASMGTWASPGIDGPLAFDTKGYGLLGLPAERLTWHAFLDGFDEDGRSGLHRALLASVHGGDLRLEGRRPAAVAARRGHDHARQAVPRRLPVGCQQRAPRKPPPSGRRTHRVPQPPVGHGRQRLPADLQRDRRRPATAHRRRDGRRRPSRPGAGHRPRQLPGPRPGDLRPDQHPGAHPPCVWLRSSRVWPTSCVPSWAAGYC
jgi:CheY-like chemotaxis protein